MWVECFFRSYIIFYGFCIIGVSIGAWSRFGLVWFGLLGLYILGLVHIVLSIGFWACLYLFFSAS